MSKKKIKVGLYLCLPLTLFLMAGYVFLDRASARIEAIRAETISRIRALEVIASRQQLEGNPQALWSFTGFLQTEEVAYFKLVAPGQGIIFESGADAPLSDGIFYESFDEGISILGLEVARLHCVIDKRAVLRKTLAADFRYFAILVAMVLAFGGLLIFGATLAEREKAAALGGMAAQVAHDIRSPLAALDSIVKDLTPLPEGKRLIVRTAVGRIRDIANDLLDKNRAVAAPTGGASSLPSGRSELEFTGLLSSHIDPIITEKRLQYRSRPAIGIEGRLDEASYGIFARFQPTDFKRALSNLINNGVEALDEMGTVIVSLTQADRRVMVKVSDNGKGIPPDILAKLGQRGATHGKPGGSGLGLYHARTCVESWGGRLDIQSEVGKGTTVTVTLPQETPPEWFVSRLELPPASAVVVLDDDASIHQVWQGRFDSAGLKRHGIEVLHFSAPAEFLGWMQGDATHGQNAIFLLDYELLGHQETGLSLAKELGLCPRAILVTSRFEEPGILDECRRMKVRMIPKGMAGFVPIDIQGPQKQPVSGETTKAGPDAILIDDDALAQMTWRMAAQAKGLKLLGLRAPGELLAALESIPKDTPIYLDCELGDGMRGDAVAKDLHAKGFANLYLATGHDPQSLPAMPWIKAVVGKDPPWA